MAALGRVLMHEHVFIISPEMQHNVPEDWGNEEDRLADAARRLTALKQSGIDSILDPTALGLGRYIPRIAELARRISNDVLPALREQGVTDAQITTMLVDTPRASFPRQLARSVCRGLWWCPVVFPCLMICVQSDCI